MTFLIKSSVVAVIILLFSAGSGFAKDEALPAEVIISSIQAAIADTPGLIKDVEVERENGKLLVEVKIIDDKGTRTKVKIDPETNTRVR